MGIILDLIVIGIIALSTFLAYKKGLVALAIKVCGVVIALVATLILYKPISNLVINVTNIDETIQNAVIENSYKVVGTNQEDGFVQSTIEQFKNDTIVQNAQNISYKAINLGVILILYFGIKIALKFVTVIADKVANLPILNKFNKIGGMVFGLVRGFAIVFACLIVVNFIGKVDPKSTVYKTVEESTICKVMNENNVLNALL